MKKIELKDALAIARADRERMRQELEKATADLRTLGREVEQMRKHWRPVPITHEWQPKNPQCALCDEPRDAARHRVDEA
jgi:hypothetical protein